MALCRKKVTGNRSGRLVGVGGGGLTAQTSNKPRRLSKWDKNERPKTKPSNVEEPHHPPRSLTKKKR